MKTKKQLLLYFTLIIAITTTFAQPGFYTNPVSDSLFIADPFVLSHHDKYYLYGTSANDGFKAWISDNLVNWDTLGYVFRRDESCWGEGSFWAPEVIQYHGKFYLIYSASGKTIYGKGLRLCMAESNQPEGPFRDLYAPLFDLGFSCIDGHVFIDEDEKPYLFYEMVGAVGEHWNNNGYLWGVIMGVELSEDLSKPLTEAKLCLYPSQAWEGINSMKARSNEGMTVFKNNSIYYMTYSGNHYADPNSGVGYATSKSPLGMWTKVEDSPTLKNDLSL